MKRFLVVWLFLALCATGVWAQEQTSGTIEGTVQSEGGTPIEDAIISVVGPQGARSATTGADGRFVVRGLTPGTYQVKATAAGYTPLVQTDVEVLIATRTQLPFTLAEGVSEVVTVTSQAPLVDLKSTGTGAAINVDDFAPYVPLGRNLVSVFSIAPGVSDGGALGSTNPSISGSSGLENAYFVDGVNITNSGYGALGAYSIVYGSLGSGVTYDFLEEVQVKTGGFEAEYGQAGGGIVNSVVRSGSNKFKLDASWYEEPAAFEDNWGQRGDVPNIANRIETTRRDIAISSGGPILKDRLFYFAAYNPIWTESDWRLTAGDDTAYFINDTNGDGVVDGTDTPVTFAAGETIQGDTVPGSVTRERSIDNYAGKFSWFVTNEHKIEISGFGDPSEGEVGPQAPTSFLRVLADPVANPDPSASLTGLDWGGDQASLKYQGVWTPNFFTELQVSYKENSFEESGPGTTFRSIFNTVTNTTSGGAGFYENLQDETLQYQLKNTHVFGPVEVKYGYSFEDIEWAQPKTYSGPTYNAYFPRLVEGVDIGGGNLGVAFAAGCSDPTNFNDSACYTTLESSTGASIDFDGTNYNVTRTEFTPPTDPTTAEDTSYFAQVSWDVIPTVTLKAGARYTEQLLIGTGSVDLPIGALSDGTVVGGMTTSLTAQEYDFDGQIAPRFGVTWDVIGDGRHKIYGNWGRYVQRVPSDLAVRAFSNEVGTTSELFTTDQLTTPVLGNTCNFDGNGDGVFDQTGPCHLVDQVQGLAGGGSIILDGTQLEPGSEVNTFLGSNAGLVTSGRTDLPYTDEWLGGYAWQFNDYSSVEVRYIHREIGRALEDIQFTSNEQTWNLFWGESGFESGIAIGDPFPGHGAGAFGAYVFANVGDNVDPRLFPVPQRDYDAIELVYNRRFHNGWLAYANYRFATLEGIYEGSFRNDNGQSDPFLTSLFDFPGASAVDLDGDGNFENFLSSDTLIGQYNPGPLNTDRRHILNLFASKQFDMGLNIGGRLNIQTGQPIVPLFAHPAYRNAGEVPGFDPTYWWGVGVDVDGDGVEDRIAFWLDSDATSSVPTGSTLADVSDDIVNWDDGLGGAVDASGAVINGTITGSITGPRLWGYQVVERDFLGRTSTEVQLDLHFSYDIDLGGGQYKVTLLLDAFNVFNDNFQTQIDNAVETRPGRPNPDFLKATQFQAPRFFRLGAKFSW